MLLVTVIGCNDNMGQPCTDSTMQQVKFLTDQVAVKVPSQWTNIDSTKFYTKSFLYSRVISSPDSASHIWIAANDYSVYEGVNLNFSSIAQEMKAKIKSLKHQTDTLIKEEVKQINGTDVSVLKYLIKDSDMKMYVGHLLFILPEKRQVEIFIQVKSDNPNDAEKTLDCILSSLTLFNEK